MPTTYTHDLFGKKMYKVLPGEIKKVIHEHGDLYRIGLHGPDILFYDLLEGKVNQHGVSMHDTPAREFFEEGMRLVRESGDQALLAYMLGFGCHYLLDSVCHPYVNQMAEEGVISHTNLEKEYDRYLMAENEKDPLHFYPSDCIVPKTEYAKTIQQVIPEISVKQIERSLHMQKTLTNLMVCDDGGIKKLLLTSLAKAVRVKKIQETAEYFMAREILAGSEGPVEELHNYFEKAVEESPKSLIELFRLSQKDIPLSERWDLTYNG